MLCTDCNMLVELFVAEDCTRKTIDAKNMHVL